MLPRNLRSVGQALRPTELIGYRNVHVSNGKSLTIQVTAWDQLCLRNKSTCPGRLGESLGLSGTGNLPFLLCLNFFTLPHGKRPLKTLSGVFILESLCHHSLEIWYVWGMSPSAPIWRLVSALPTSLKSLFG